MMVSEAMVEAGCKAHFNWYASDATNEGQRNTARKQVRTILEAALSTDAEPLAARYGFDGHGFQYIDSGSGSDWKTRKPDAEMLYDRPQQPAPSVAVKDLEWHDRHDIPLRANDLLAESVVGQYAIRPSSTGKRFRLWMPGMDYNKAGVHFTVERAKADAQADYEARIRSALFAQVQDASAKSLADAYQKYLDASRLYNERLAISKTKAPGTMRVDEERRAIDEARRAFDKLAVDIAMSALPAAPAAKQATP